MISNMVIRGGASAAEAYSTNARALPRLRGDLGKDAAVLMHSAIAHEEAFSFSSCAPAEY